MFQKKVGWHLHLYAQGLHRKNVRPANNIIPFSRHNLPWDSQDWVFLSDILTFRTCPMRPMSDGIFHTRLHLVRENVSNSIFKNGFFSGPASFLVGSNFRLRGGANLLHQTNITSSAGQNKHIPNSIWMIPKSTQGTSSSNYHLKLIYCLPHDQNINPFLGFRCPIRIHIKDYCLHESLIQSLWKL